MMIKYAYSANQELPNELCKKILKTKEVKNRVGLYLERLNSNDINILNKLKEKGCTYAFVTNILINQFLSSNNYEYDDELFKNTFGFSLMADENTIDYNILMVDIFSTLYNNVKMDIHKYDVYHYNSAIDAANGLLNVSCFNESDAVLKLLEAGYLLDGKEIDGKCRYKRQTPSSSTIYGTYEEIAQKLFNIPQSEFTIQKLQDELLKNEMIYNVSFESPESKFSGLLKSNSLNFWVNYYLMKKETGLTFESNDIHKDISNYDGFRKYIEKLLSDGYTIGISTGPGSNVSVISENSKISESISTKSAGHQMTLLGFNENDDFLVESWGNNFVIPKEKYDKLEFVSTKINYSNLTKENNEIQR